MEPKDTSGKKPVNRMNKTELLQEIKKLGKETTKLKQDAAEKKDSVELLKLEAERDEWKEKAIHHEEELAKQEAFKKEFEEKVKKERKHKDKQLSKLEQKVEELNAKEKNEKNEQGHSLDSLHKSSFRLDFYRQAEGEVNGKIEHLISRQKEVLNGYEEQKLLGFIKKHIQHFLIHEEDAKPKTSSKELKKIDTRVKESEKAVITQEKEQYPESGTLKIKHKLTDTPIHVISREESVLVSMSFDTSEMDNSAVYQWEAQLFSKPMQHVGKSVLIGNYKGNEVKGTNIVVEISTDYLPLGPNRVNANLDLFKIENHRRIQHGSYHMSGLAYIQ